MNVTELNKTIEKKIKHLKQYLNNLNYLDNSDINYLDTLFKYLDQSKYNYINIGNIYIINVENDSYAIQYAS